MPLKRFLHRYNNKFIKKIAFFSLVPSSTNSLYIANLDYVTGTKVSEAHDRFEEKGYFEHPDPFEEDLLAQEDEKELDEEIGISF